jgi:5-methylthioadenosine/S-adenosylhomocysteine deaminase
LRKPHLVPLDDLPTAVVLGAQASDVDTVIVNGRTVMEGRQVRTLDEAAILTAAEEAGQDLRRRAGLNGPRPVPA